MSLKKESLKGSNNQIQCKNFANKSHKLVFKQVEGRSPSYSGMLLQVPAA